MCGRVEQPVGTGYTVGTPTATTEEQIAQDFVKFFKNFQTTFGIKNFKVFVTGESCKYGSREEVKEALFDMVNVGSNALTKVFRGLEKT